MVDFVVDKGLDVLLAQINAKAPGRSKASDGSVGDPDHQTRQSDHNPEDTRDSDDGNDPDNQVDARDFTHDPAHGADMGKISEAIRRSKDVRVKYVIFNKRIFSGRNGTQPWVWRPYTGSNDHSHHMHVSVVDSPNDNTALWQIGGLDMTPGQAYTLHVINYRAEAIVAMRHPIVIPAFEVRDDTGKIVKFPAITEDNKLALQMREIYNKPAGTVDVEALAAQLAELLEVGASVEQIKDLLATAQATSTWTWINP